MIVPLQSSSFENLLNELNIDIENVQSHDTERLISWIRSHIKSDFDRNDFNSAKHLVNSFFDLNNKNQLNTNLDDDLNYTVLHKASQLGFDRFIESALTLTNKDKLDNTINASSKIGNSPLHVAALKGHVDCVEILLEYDANANVFNHEKKLPINLAATSIEDSNKAKKIIRSLLAHTRQDALSQSAQSGNNLLLKAIRFNDLDLMHAVLQKDNALLHLNDDLGQNVLHLAIIENANNLFDFLVQDEELLTNTTANHSTTLHLACRYGSDELIQKLLQQSACQNSDYLNTRDEHGNTPLHYLAKRGGNDDLINQMIELGSRVDIRNTEKKTPLGLKPY